MRNRLSTSMLFVGTFLVPLCIYAWADCPNQQAYSTACPTSETQRDCPALSANCSSYLKVEILAAQFGCRSKGGTGKECIDGTEPFPCYKTRECKDMDMDQVCEVDAGSVVVHKTPIKLTADCS